MIAFNPLYGKLGKTALFTGLSYFVVACVQSIWHSAFQNYAISMYQITPVQMGIAFSLVSIPGFFSVVVGLMGTKIRLRVLLSFSFVLIGLGMIGASLTSINAIYLNTGWFTSWYMLVFCLLLLHVGFVMYYPTINTVFLIGVDSVNVVKRLSSLKSLWPLAGVVAPAVFVQFLSARNYAALVAAAGGVVFLVGALNVTCTPFGQYADKQHRLRINKGLAPYYLLNFLNGCRSAIFKTFVIYYLITECQFDLKNTAAIVLAGNLMTFTGYQLIGRLAKRFCPSKLLGLIYLVMCVNFLGFMGLKSTVGLSLVYLLDSLVFCTSAITDSYLKVFSGDKSLLSDLSAGVSLYHLGKVLMPVIAGLLYAGSDAHAFLLGSLCTLFSYSATRMLCWRKSERRETGPAADGIAS